MTTVSRIPKKVKILIDGEEKEVSVADNPDLTNLIKVAGQVEKDKVYATIEDLQRQVAQVREQQNGQQNQPAAPANPAAPRSPQSPQNPEERPITMKDVKEIIKQVNEESGVTVDAITERMEQRFNESLNPILQTSNELKASLAAERSKKVGEYRERRIAELGDTIIPDLVEGETIEEVEASIVKSQTIRAKYPATAAAPNSPNGGNNGQDEAAPAAPARPGAHPTPQEQGMPNVKDIPNATWGGKREEVLEKMKQQYGG